MRYSLVMMLRILLLALGLPLGWDRVFAQEELPTGFLPGQGTLDVRVAGKSLRARWPELWDSRTDYETSLGSGVALRFVRAEDGSGGRMTLTWRPRRTDDERPRISCVVRIPNLASARPRRFHGGSRRDVVWLSYRGAGVDAARGLARSDRVSEWGVDLGIWDGFHVGFEGDGESGEGVVRVTGAVPPGNEVAVFAWKHVRTGEPASSRDSNVRLEGPGLVVAGKAGTRAILAAVDRCLEERGALRYVEIEDGWQSKSTGVFSHPGRDWEKADAGLYPGGLEALVEQLEDRGVACGVWVVPHGYTDSTSASKDKARFVVAADGKIVPGGVLGPQVIDPVNSRGLEHLASLVRSFQRRGLRFLRLGELGTALAFYKSYAGDLRLGTRTPEGAFVASLDVMRRVAGDSLLLLGGEGTPESAFSSLSRVRPGWNSRAGSHPLRQEAAALASRLHRQSPQLGIDPIAVGDEASIVLPDLRRFARLSGRDLPITANGDERPRASIDVLSIDAFARAEGEPVPRVWVLKVGDTPQSRSHDLVALANWNDREPETIRLSAQDLGRNSSSQAEYAVVDLGNRELFYRGLLPVEVTVLAGEIRYFSVQRLTRSEPRVISIGGDPTAHLARMRQVTWVEETQVLRGSLALDREESIEMSIFCPEGRSIESVESQLGSLRVVSEEGDSLLRVVLSRGDDRVPVEGVDWSLKFGEPKPRAPGVSDLRVARAELLSSGEAVLLSWQSAGPSDGRHVFHVYRGKERVGSTIDRRFVDRGLKPGTVVEYRVATARVEDAVVKPVSSAAEAKIAFAMPDIEDAWLAARDPVGFRGDTARPGINLSASGGPLLIRGKRFKHGVGQRVPQAVDFDVGRAFGTFEALLAIDDASRVAGSARFVVRVDGVVAYRSPVVLGSDVKPLRISIPIYYCETLTLEVERGESGSVSYANWLDARLVREARQPREPCE
ncbi:MAG: NPCBM/NEW2 domain-containing protein [Planctomycetota bacterium]